MKAPPGDQVRVSVNVPVTPDVAFRLFTRDIDRWWRRGRKYRAIGGRSVLHLEDGVGGRLYEVVDDETTSRIVHTGTVTLWSPPERFVLEWRPVNFAPDEVTEVDVQFSPVRRGTLVTLTHRGWSKLRADHPVRHGEPPPVFIRRYARWWGDQATAYRVLAEAEG